MSTRNERVNDLFLEDRTAEGNPSEEGMVRRVGNDILALLGGQVKSLTAQNPLPPATQVGQVLYGADGASFTVELPVTGPHGWLVNDAGILLVNG